MLINLIVQIDGVMLIIPGYKLPWEQDKIYEGHFEQPLKIIIEASNGASEYGNKFGEPVIGGFFRAFGEYFLMSFFTL